MAALPNSALERVPGHARSAFQSLQFLDLKAVFNGCELAGKDCRLRSGLAPIDTALEGGIVRGRISEFIGYAGSGRTSLAVAFVASAIRDGEVAAWIDSVGTFDPMNVAAAGVDLARMLWVRCNSLHRGSLNRSEGQKKFLKAAEMVIETDGFGLVVLDFADRRFPISQSAALRIARRAKDSTTAVLVLAAQRMCGTFATMSLALIRNRACFSRLRPDAPALFDGITIEACVTRNKLGGSGTTITWRALSDPVLQATLTSQPIATSAPALTRHRI